MKKIKYIILIILGVIVLLSSCSMFPSEVERHLFFDSICWEDDSHILMYTMVRKWVNTSWMSWGSETGYWDWSQGEIWRINVFTGEKELLLRREGDYYTGLSTPIKIDVLGDRKLISLDGNAYIMEGESSDWQEIEGIYEAEWVNENEIVGIEEETGDVVKYDLLNSTIENRYYTLNEGRNLISCDSPGSICLISENYTKLIVLKNGNIESIYGTRTDTITNTNDSIYIPYWYYKPFCFDLDRRVIITNGYMNNIPNNYIITLDSLNLLKGFTTIEIVDVMPRPDLKYIAASDNNREYLIIYDNNNEIINTILFELDKLE